MFAISARIGLLPLEKLEAASSAPIDSEAEIQSGRWVRNGQSMHQQQAGAALATIRAKGRSAGAPERRSALQGSNDTL